MVYVVLADGFEEIEALAFFDIIKRADIDSQLVSINASKCVTGAHGIKVCTDLHINDVNKEKITAFVLPGGMPGTVNLRKSPEVCDILKYCYEKNILIGAICAAPSVLGELGMLKGKKATCFPGFEDKLEGAEFTSEKVVKDGNIITAKGAGCAHDFAFEFVKVIKDTSLAENIKKSMQY